MSGVDGPKPPRYQHLPAGGLRAQSALAPLYPCLGGGCHMLVRVLKCLGIVGALGVCLSCLRDLSAQAPGAPPVPKGVEVMARGPVHEAFATPTAEAEPTTPIPKKPPLPLEEM